MAQIHSPRPLIQLLADDVFLFRLECHNSLRVFEAKHDKHFCENAMFSKKK